MQDLPMPGYATAARGLSACLVNMPWTKVNMPSIQCGLLKAIATREGAASMCGT